MFGVERREGGANASLECYYTSKDSKVLFKLQELKELADYYAHKYRYDPFMQEIHGAYQLLIETALKECEHGRS